MVQSQDFGQVPRERFDSRVKIMVSAPAGTRESVREIHQTDRDRCRLCTIRGTLHMFVECFYPDLGISQRSFTSASM